MASGLFILEKANNSQLILENTGRVQNREATLWAHDAPVYCFLALLASSKETIELMRQDGLIDYSCL